MHTKGICVSVGSVVSTLLLVLAMLFGVQPAYADDESDTANLSWAITTDPRTGQLTSAKVDFPGGITFFTYEVRVVKDGLLVWESGVQMLADNPTRYYQNEDCTRYIASVPTTWDETRALEAKVGEYIVVAKRKGSKWFIGGITNGTPRDFRLKLDFLGAGNHKLTAFKDGLSADYQAMHYNKVEQNVTSQSTIDVHMVKNGGWAAVIE